LPARVQEALGELANVAREGLMALSVGVGLGVLAELMEEEVTDVVGPRGRHDPDRSAVRHGYEAGEVTLGGRRVPVERPRVRASDGSGEVPIETYQHFAGRDVLGDVVLARLLASVSMRRYHGTNEPGGSSAPHHHHDHAPTRLPEHPLECRKSRYFGVGPLVGFGAIEERSRLPSRLVAQGTGGASLARRTRSMCVPSLLAKMSRFGVLWTSSNT
jgi:hypothetical protein